MKRPLVHAAICGAVAGAAGTMALDITSYGDMVLRGRPASDLPADVIRRIAERAGLNSFAKPDDQADEALRNRRSALGALGGYGVGLSIGTVYGMIRPYMRGVPWAVTAVALGALAMAASDVPAAQLRATDPRTWGVGGWLSDIVPHLIYGATTALVYDTLTREA